MIYASESLALAALELLANSSGVAPENHLSLTLEIPDDLIAPLDVSLLPEGWKTLVPSEQTITRTIGDDWVKSGESAVLAVPSAVINGTNYLLNPKHPRFRRIVPKLPAVPFEFDLRFPRRAPT
jgi:RES domain-containing protein